MRNAVSDLVPLDIAKVKSLREKLGLSQEQAAHRAGFRSRQEWWFVESGRRADLTVSRLERIAGALGVKARDLLK